MPNIRLAGAAVLLAGLTSHAFAQSGEVNVYS